MTGHIKIEWLSTSSDCDQCGGNYADGARVTLDGKPLLELIPRASCFGSEDDWERDEVLLRTLRALGYEVTA